MYNSNLSPVKSALMFLQSASHLQHFPIHCYIFHKIIADVVLDIFTILSPPFPTFVLGQCSIPTLPNPGISICSCSFDSFQTHLKHLGDSWTFPILAGWWYTYPSEKYDSQWEG